MIIAIYLFLLGELGRMESKGILDYIPILGLVANVIALCAAYVMLKLTLASFQASVTEMKGELAGLAEEVRNGFERVSEKFVAIGERVARLETIRDMLGRKPGQH